MMKMMTARLREQDGPRQEVAAIAARTPKVERFVRDKRGQPKRDRKWVDSETGASLINYR